MMEVENADETVSLETTSCLSTNIGRDNTSDREESLIKILNDSNKNSTLDSDHRCPPQPSDSITELSNIYQESFQEDHIKTNPNMAKEDEMKTFPMIMDDDKIKIFPKRVGDDEIKTFPKMGDDDKIKTFPKRVNDDEIKTFPKIVDDDEIKTFPKRVGDDEIKTFPKTVDDDKIKTFPKIGDDDKIKTFPKRLDDDKIKTFPKRVGDDEMTTIPKRMDDDEIKTFPKMVDTAYRSKVIRDNMKASVEKCPSESRAFNSDPDTDEYYDHPDDVHGSPEDASPNEETSDIPVTKDTSSCNARRTRRKSKRKLVNDFCCPVCSITVRQPELAAHYRAEVEKLTKIPGNLMKLRPRKSDGISTPFVQVKSNRENRLTAKVAKYAVKASKEIQCPICKLRISGHEEDVNKHVALCVQNEEVFDEHIVVDDDEDDYESFEEYEVVSTRDEALERPTTKRTRYDENEEVEVDIDDTKTYGEPQYTELDVITNSTDGNSEQLRKAVLGNPFAQPHILESRKWGNIVGNSLGEHKLDDAESNENMEVADQTVSSLKEKIKDLEDQNKSVKCLICMEPYTRPVVSTTCWHVHCEECWLTCMGVKKLCPQCNMIVFPSDLRKIYL